MVALRRPSPFTVTTNFQVLFAFEGDSTRPFQTTEIYTIALMYTIVIQQSHHIIWAASVAIFYFLPYPKYYLLKMNLLNFSLYVLLVIFLLVVLYYIAQFILILSVLKSFRKLSSSRIDASDNDIETWDAGRYFLPDRL